MVLTTPTGLLSDNIPEGEEKKIQLLVRNTGSSDLKDIKFNSSAPANWEVTFDPKKVDRLEPGESAQVNAIVKVAKRAIVGDYITRIEASSQGVVSKAEFRISVRTTLFMGLGRHNDYINCFRRCGLSVPEVRKEVSNEPEYN